MSELNTLDLTDLNTDEEPSIQMEINDADEPVEDDEPTVDEEPVEDEVPTVDEPVEPAEDEEPTVQEVVSNVKEILSEPVPEVPEVSFTDKFNELNRIVLALGFRDPWSSRLSTLNTSSDSDTDKLRELIDVLKDWRFKPEYRNKLVSIRDDTELSVEDRFLQVVNIVERIGLREPFRSQLIALK